MQAAGVADVGNVGLLGERFVKRVEGTDVVNLFDVALLVGAHRRREHVGETAHAIGDDLDRLAEQRTEIAGMPLTNAAEADNEDLHRVAPLLLSPVLPDERKLPAYPVDLIAVFAASDLQSYRPVIADLLHACEDTGQVR